MEHQRARDGGASQRLRFAFRNIALFVLFFSGTVLYSNTFAPNTKTFWRDRFIHHVERIEEGAFPSQGAYVLVFGASLTSLNFVPDVFERTMQALGKELRVYNLGVPGARGHEVNYYIQRTVRHLEKRGAPLPEYVLIDSMLPFTGYIPESQAGTIRTVEWHSLSETASALVSLMREKEVKESVVAPAIRIGGREKLRLLGAHCRNLVKKYVPLGRALDYFDDPLLKQGAGGALAVGYQEYDEDAEPTVEPGILRDLIETKIAELESKPTLETFNLKAWTAQVKFLTDRGITPVYFLPPSFGSTRPIHLLEEKGFIPELPAFDDPRTRPEYWDVEARQNFGHLKSGPPSRRFTAELAKEIHERIVLKKEAYLRSLGEAP